MAASAGGGGGGGSDSDADWDISMEGAAAPRPRRMRSRKKQSPPLTVSRSSAYEVSTLRGYDQEAWQSPDGLAQQTCQVVHCRMPLR